METITGFRKNIQKKEIWRKVKKKKVSLRKDSKKKTDFTYLHGYGLSAHSIGILGLKKCVNSPKE